MRRVRPSTSRRVHSLILLQIARVAHAPPERLAPSSCLVWKFGVLLSSLRLYSLAANADSPRPLAALAAAAARKAAFRSSFSFAASSSDFAFAAAAVESAPEVSAPKATPRKALRRDDGDASAASEMDE